MIPNYKINEAYDSLNLSRDSTTQSVRDRYRTLQERFAADPDKLKKLEEAFKLLEQHDETVRAQRDMIAMGTKSKSERELDNRLAQMRQDAGFAGGIKRITSGDEPDVKKQKVERVKEEPVTLSTQGDEQVFVKLCNLLRDESKFLRAVSVLFNIVSSIIEKGQYDASTIRLLVDTVDVAATVASASGFPIASSDEENRRALTKVVNLIIATEELGSHITKIERNAIKNWTHSVIFRNSLFELDNFTFIKRCKELVALVNDANIPVSNDEEERFLKELLITIETMACKEVSRIIPGRLQDTKTHMTEIYKLSRNPKFPTFFSEKIAQVQKYIMSY